MKNLCASRHFPTPTNGGLKSVVMQLRVPMVPKVFTNANNLFTRMSYSNFGLKSSNTVLKTEPLNSNLNIVLAPVSEQKSATSGIVETPFFRKLSTDYM